MKIVDVNVLLYAVNRDAIHHSRVLAWWQNALASQEPIGLAWIVLLGFLRLSTNGRVFRTPLSTETAMERIDAWLGHENVRVAHETEDQWAVVRRLLTDTGTSGNRTTDAHLAALAITHGATLVSCDCDFARYRQLRWENPAASEA